MRSLRTLMLAAGLLGMAPALAGAQTGPKALLELHPSQKGVEYEVPNTPAAIDACKVEVVYVGKKAVGYSLRDGQGKLLRKFIDSNGSGKMNQWSYYQDGFEVYRECALHNKGLDECRWLNGGGTRVARIAGGKIASWKRLSAEEASKVLVQALVTGDLVLLETVLATPEELETLGLPKSVGEKATAAAPQRTQQVNALLQGLTRNGWNSKTLWGRLDGMMPHLIPADPGSGLGQDIILYENAVIFPAPSGGQGNLAKMAFLQAPDLVKLGEVWKFVELPRAIEPDKAIVMNDGGLRALLTKDAPAGSDQDPEVKAALDKLAKFQTENQALLAATDKREVARYHVGVVPLHHAVVKVAKDAETKLTHNRAIVDSLAAAYQTGVYPKGLELLNGIITDGGEAASYAAFRKVSAEFALKNEAGEPPLASQKKWMADLKVFADNYPKSAEAPDALFQLAQGYEFNAEEDEARKYYTQITQVFPSTDASKKAAGALKRLDLVGKPLELAGPGLKNEAVSASTYRGKTLLVFFWATWAEPVKRDLPELGKLSRKFKAQGFEVLGVNLDNERADVAEFLKANAVPGAQIYEPGGMDSRLATEFGIISLPTMILVDAQGKVVNRNIRTAAELDRQLEKVLPAKGNGVALGVK